MSTYSDNPYLTDQEIITILSRRHCEVLDELEHARRLAVLLEQQRAMETAHWRRNPVNAGVELERRGYAVYNGPWDPRQCQEAGCVLDEGHPLPHWYTHNRDDPSGMIPR